MVTWLYLHFDQDRKGGVPELLSPARWQIDLYLCAIPVQQLNLRGAIGGQGQCLEAFRVVRSRVVEDSRKTMILGGVNT